MSKRNQRVAVVVGVVTVLGLAVSVFTWNNLAHSAYHDAGYFTFDEVLSVLWLFGFGVYLTMLAAAAIAATVLFVVVAPVCRWINAEG